MYMYLTTESQNSKYKIHKAKTDGIAKRNRQRQYYSWRFQYLSIGN